MDIGIVFEKMLVLLIMIFVGSLVYRLGIIGKGTNRQISNLLVKILNPAILLSSAMGDTSGITGSDLLIVGAFTILRNSGGKSPVRRCGGDLCGGL